MAEPLTLTTERLDDMPLVLAPLERLGLQPLLDEQFPTHGNGVGLRLGWVRVLWRTPRLSEGDHRRNHVAPWAQERLHTLRSGTGRLGHPLDVSDDRLATVLEALRDETHWSACEGALKQHTRRGYDRQPTGSRVDSTTANGHWSVTADGLLPFGPRQDQRPDRPQVKGRRAAVDPLGMPVATDVVPGQRADAPRYVPAITRVREGLGQRRRLDVGDCQRAALEPRAFRHAGGDDSVCPLSERQLPPMRLADDLAPVWAGEQAVTVRHRAPSGGTSKLVAEGVERLESVTAAVAGQPPGGRERRWIVRSFALAQAGARGLRARVAQAQAAVTALNTRGRGQRRDADPSALRPAVEALRARYRGQDLWHVRDQEQWWAQPLRRDGGRDATVRLEWDVQVTVRLDEEARATAVRQLGGRVSVTTPPRSSGPGRRPSWHPATTTWSSGPWAA